MFCEGELESRAWGVDKEVFGQRTTLGLIQTPDPADMSSGIGRFCERDVPVVLGQRSSSLFKEESLPVPGDRGLFIPETEPAEALAAFFGLYEQRPA